MARSKDPENQGIFQPTPTGDKHIGPWAFAGRTERGNATKLTKYCGKYQLFATNTHTLRPRVKQ